MLKVCFIWVEIKGFLGLRKGRYSYFFQFYIVRLWLEFVCKYSWSLNQFFLKINEFLSMFVFVNVECYIFYVILIFIKLI